MEYLLGNKKEFQDFINKITKKDKIAILTHNDLDGVASAIFLEQILSEKGLTPDLVRFIDLKKSIFKKETKILNDKKITKTFLTDINADAFENFEEFYNQFDLFMIDHHPIHPSITNKKNIIKTSTRDCSALTIYELGKEIIDSEKWNWLVCAAAISDMAFRKKENLEFIKKYYPTITEKGIFGSVPGEICQKISFSLTYYGDDTKKVYDLIKEKKLYELEDAYKKVRKEIDKYVEKFKEEAEFHPEKNLYFYHLSPEFNIASIVCTIVANKEPEKSFIFTSDLKKDHSLKISSRNQSGNRDMNLLLKNATKELANASGGGHVNAAGGNIMKQDLEKFKKNILNEN